MTASHRIAEHPYRAFDAEVKRVERLSPSFVRVTFGGPDLRHFADNGNDQRLKLVFPLAHIGLSPFPRSGDWYAQWQALPTELRNPIRTYTVRAVRSEIAELDVDIVLHGDGGPASRWAARATAGDQIVLVGPDRNYPGETVAAEWRPHPGATSLLIGADATALPAAAAILAGLADSACGTAVLEVPTEADRITINAPGGMRIEWRVQHGAPGAALEAGVRWAAAALVRPPVAQGDDPGLSIGDLLWDVPGGGAGQAARSSIYAWLAGEAGAVVRLRRHLVRDLAVDRKSLAFMGYWRAGQAEC